MKVIDMKVIEPPTERCVCGHSAEDHSQVNLNGFPCFVCNCQNFKKE